MTKATRDEVRGWLPTAITLALALMAWGGYRERIGEVVRTSERHDRWIQTHSDWGNAKYAEIIGALGEIRSDIKSLLRSQAANDARQRNSLTSITHGPPTGGN